MIKLIKRAMDSMSYNDFKIFEAIIKYGYERGSRLEKLSLEELERLRHHMEISSIENDSYLEVDEYFQVIDTFLDQQQGR